MIQIFIPHAWAWAISFLIYADILVFKHLWLQTERAPSVLLERSCRKWCWLKCFSISNHIVKLNIVIKVFLYNFLISGSNIKKQFIYWQLFFDVQQTCTCPFESKLYIFVYFVNIVPLICCTKRVLSHILWICFTRQWLTVFYTCAYTNVEIFHAYILWVLLKEPDLLFMYYGSICISLFIAFLRVIKKKKYQIIVIWLYRNVFPLNLQLHWTFIVVVVVLYVCIFNILHWLLGDSS